MSMTALTIDSTYWLNLQNATTRHCDQVRQEL
jgi:hypothetical protein